ncbi:MAG: hypothetical protein WCE79_03280 [Xanthobacteraceae bacterium]
MSDDDSEPDPAAVAEWQRIVEIERQRQVRLRQLRDWIFPPLQQGVFFVVFRGIDHLAENSGCGGALADFWCL